MRWFAICCVELQNISKRSRWELLQLVTLFLSVPCFRLSHFCFKIAYTLQQRELLRLGRKCVALGGDDYSLKFDNLGLNLGTDLEAHKRLENLARRLEASRCT